MLGPNVAVSRDLVNDYIYQVIACIDPITPDPEELRKARKILLEMSDYIIHAPIKDVNQKTRPTISRK